MTAAPGSPAVEIRGLEVRYGEILALHDAHLAVAPGRVCGLVGMNGAGKTSLLRSVLGLTRPVSGVVLVDGAPPAAARRAGTVAYVPQSEDVDWDFPLCVLDVVSTGRYAHQGPLRRARPADREAVASALARVGLAGLSDRQIGALSGGQRKRAFVARAIAQDARLLLLDEPFAGVDTATQEDLTTLLRELAASGATVLVSTHDLESVPALCDEVALVAGTVVDHGPPGRLLEAASLARAFGRAVA
ncbi:MAG: metal ABC transporter ATP-binding protein [Actinomycetota bacterium]|nr:metal ABC transporter ATP-binding protein [Actinomycetota bacterium]